MRRLLAAIAFLTRLPVPVRALEAADIGKATLWFPLVGALLGAIQALAAWALAGRLPSLVAAVLVVAVGAALTGALHLDGLADTADGFGGGRTRDDVLRIMRDHAVGAYGVVAVVLLLALKIAVVATLVQELAAGSTGAWSWAWSWRGGATGCGCSALRVLAAAAALGRWTAVPLGRFLPYARRDAGGLGASVTDHVGPAELLGATLLAAAIAIAARGAAGLLWLGAVALMTIAVGAVSRRRIGGITGDVMGAATELGEAVVYVLAVSTVG